MNLRFGLNLSWIFSAPGIKLSYPETQVSLIGDHFQSQNQQLRFVGKFSGPGLKNEVQLNCVAKK